MVANNKKKREWKEFCKNPGGFVEAELKEEDEKRRKRRARKLKGR